MAVLLLTMTTSCFNKEQMYEGMGAAEQNRQTENPSCNPITASEQAQPEYYIYKMKCQEILKKNESVNNEVK